MFSDNLRKVYIFIILISCIILAGTTSYFYIENFSLFNAFYMTIITLSTVGFAEIQELSQAGRIITLCIITSGLTIGAYALGSLLKLIVEGELTRTLGRRKLDKKISSLKNHYIICGYGRIGSLIASELEKNKINFVIIENNPEIIEELTEAKYNYINMDATNEEALEEANITKAKGLATAVQSDADNVFITLTARSMNPDIFILARSSDRRTEKKLTRAGASQVILPYLIGGRRMAQALIRPTVVDFLDIALYDSKLDLTMEEILIEEESIYSEKNLIESNIRRDFGIIVIAIKKSSGQMIFNPVPQEVLNSGDILVALGKHADLLKLRKKT